MAVGVAVAVVGGTGSEMVFTILVVLVVLFVDAPAEARAGGIGLSSSIVVHGWVDATFLDGASASGNAAIVAGDRGCSVRTSAICTRDEQKDDRIGYEVACLKGREGVAG